MARLTMLDKALASRSVFETNYKDHPDYNNKEWVKEIKKNLGEKGFQQEIESSFIGADNVKTEKKHQLIKMLCEMIEEENVN